MKQIFVDTLYWVGLINSNDQWHEKIREVSGAMASANLVTTEAVLIEVLNFFSSYKPSIRARVARTVREIINKPNIEVVFQSYDLFNAGLALYEQRLDKGYSMVDCISMVVMQHRSLTEVLTHDQHFKQEGFTILL